VRDSLGNSGERVVYKETELRNRWYVVVYKSKKLRKLRKLRKAWFYYLLIHACF